MRGKKFMRIAGYIAFAVVALLFFLYATFPAPAVAQRLAHEVQRMTDGTVAMTFSDASLYRFSGIAAEGVKLRFTSDDGGEAGSKPMEIELDRVSVRVRLLPLLVFNLSASIGAELGAGSLDAVVSMGDDGVEFEVEIVDLDFASPPLLARLTGVPVNGKLVGKAKGKLSMGALRRRPGQPAGGSGFAPEMSEGQASLTLREAGFGPGAVAGFTIPAAIGFGQIDLALDMRRGRLRLASFQQKGGNVGLKASGTVTLRRNLKASNLDTCLQFKFTDKEYLIKYPKVNTMLQFAQVQLRKDGEGFLHWKFGGTIGNPRRQSGLCRKVGRK